MAKNIMFSITGSIQNSAFAFYEMNEEEVKLTKDKFLKNDNVYLSNPLLLQETKGVGTISHYMNEKKYKEVIDKDERSPRNSNLISNNIAQLSTHKNFLAINGSFKIINNFTKPSLSDSPELRLALKNFVNEYRNEFDLSVLLKRYFQNIFLGRTFWRNSIGFNKSVLIKLKSSSGVIKHIFECDNVSSDFNSLVFKNESDNTKLNEIIKKINEETKNISDFIQIELIYLVELGFGAETFPSQTFTENKKETEGKLLAFKEIPEGKQVILHSQKFGNGLRTIDDWYNNYSLYEEVIPVEVYGALISQREDRRALKNGSFFDYFNEKFPKYVEEYKNKPENEKHYLMAMFIKGGVLGIGKD